MEGWPPTPFPVHWLAEIAARLDGEALRAWCLMQSRVNSDGLLPATDDDLATMLGVSVRTTIRLRAALSQAGALHVARRTGRANVYRITPPDGVGPIMAVM